MVGSVGFRNGDLVAKNITFDYTTNPQPGQPGVITSDGQLLIGSITTTPNIAMSAGNIIADTGVTVTYVYPNIKIGLTGGSAAIEKIAVNSGSSPVLPLGGQITLVTANATVQFVGTPNIITQDFALTNLVLGSSLPSLAGGTINVGVGFHALNGLTSGSANTAIGYAALLLNTSASSNTAVGEVALSNNLTSPSNTAIGLGALNALASGTGSNVALGLNSLHNLGTGNNNIALGTSAGLNYTTSESSNIMIGNAGVITESNKIRIGTTGSGVAQQNACYIAGIDGVNVGSVARVVTEASDQLGTATITAGAGISVTPTANTITIAATAAGFTWNDQTADLNPIVKENGYFADKAASRLVLTLPTNAVAGDTYAIAGFGSQGWQVVAGVGQVIQLGNQVTSTNGTLTSTNQWDQLEIVCSPITSIFIVRYSIGNITVA